MRLDADRCVLVEGAGALGSPLPVSGVEQLMAYATLLQRWNRVYNLTAVRDVEQTGPRHLLDSLSVVAPLRRHFEGARLTTPRLLDVGSGGGLPGVVLAIAQPDWAVQCVDAVAKKVAFIRQAAAELGLRNLRAEHRRVGQGEGRREASVVVSRAFASLPDFCAWTRDELAPGGVWLAMKGRQPSEEIAALPAETEVFHVEPLRVPGLDAERCAVWLRPADPSADLRSSAQN